MGWKQNASECVTEVRGSRATEEREEEKWGKGGREVPVRHTGEADAQDIAV